MLRPATPMLILTVSGLKVLGPVLAQGPVNRLTVNNPSCNKRKRADKTSGRKQPRLQDVDVDVEPANDGVDDVAALLIAAVADSSQSSETASTQSGEGAMQQVADSDQPPDIEAIAIDTSICHACDLHAQPAKKCHHVTGMISWVGCESCPHWYHRVCLGKCATSPPYIVKSC